MRLCRRCLAKVDDVGFCESGHPQGQDPIGPLEIAKGPDSVKVTIDMKLTITVTDVDGSEYEAIAEYERLKLRTILGANYPDTYSMDLRPQ